MPLENDCSYVATYSPLMWRSRSCILRTFGSASHSPVLQAWEILERPIFLLLFAIASTSIFAADTLIADFEGPDFAGWTATGEAFGAAPAKGSVGRQKPGKGIIGKGHANSFHGDDPATGTLTSPPFTIGGSHLSFRLGGGDHKGKTCLNLIIDGEVVRSAAAHQHGDFLHYFWELAEFAGYEATLQLVDDHSGSWGYIAADHIVLHDAKPARALPAVEGDIHDFVPSDLGKATMPKAKAPAQTKPTVITSEKFTLPGNLVTSVFADVSMVMNPVALCFDPQGRLYVAETHRWHKFAENQGVFDNRTRRWWVAQDLASSSTADRLAMYRRWESKFPLSAYREYSERIIRLTDTDGDGKADQRSIFADGFNDPLDGPGIGLIHGHKRIYYTCIPHLWALHDDDDDGVAEIRESLQEGFGTRVGISGHDMHGLIWGPDGKLYFSIGDRGYTLKTKDGRTLRDELGGGAVFRCDHNGENLEVFYTGLRNPQELAFDQFGNLFTVDNNMGRVDKSRLNYIIEGGDTGWSTGHQQFVEFRQDVGFDDFSGTSAWEAERLWDLQHEGQRAWILPPIAHITNGPAGLVFNSGMSFGERYHHRFFICDFRGGASRTFIRAFGVEPKGAGFDIVDPHTFYGGIACADIDIGPDGKIYLADYAGTGATTLDQGNILTIHDPEAIKNWNPGGGLYSDHFQERLSAQFEIVLGCGIMNCTPKLLDAVKQTEHRFARLHGIWGLGQLRMANAIRPYITDPDLEVRHAVIQTLGNLRDKASGPAIHKALIDNSPRVRAAAAIALGKLQYAEALPTLIALIEANADRDPFLRHALVMALAGSAGGPPASLSHSPNRSVRLAALLAHRKLRSPQVADFLSDADPFIVAEAGTACNDLLLGLEILADIRPEAATRMDWVRILNANYRLGTTEHAKAILTIAADSAIPEGARLDALWFLGHWPGETGLDPSVGRIRPLTTERPAIAEAIREDLLALLKTAKGKVRALATRLAGQLNIPLDDAALIATLRDAASGLDVRLEVLAQLAKKQPAEIATTFHALTSDKDAGIRHAALRALADSDPALAVVAVKRFIDHKDLGERQAGYRALAHIQHPEAVKLLLPQLQNIGKLPGMALDIYEACELRKEPEIVEVLATLNAELAETPLGAFAYSLEGGDASTGKEIIDAGGLGQCLVCHKIKGKGGDAAPDLSSIGLKDRAYLLESLILPQAQIATGFGISSFTLNDGAIVAGAVISESPTILVVRAPDGQETTLALANIASRTPPVSAMPPIGQLLSKQDVRHIVAYLAGLKAKNK
jgi:quinoprotein glucose dehydrogenase